MFAFLYARYHRGQATGREVHGFELVNEPNYQLWPQRGPSGPATPSPPGRSAAQHAVAEMMVTARGRRPPSR